IAGLAGEGLETPNEELETPNEGLQTPNEGLETPGEDTVGLKTTREAMANLETTEEAKGSLETTITRCLEQEKGGLETTREVTEGLESTRGTGGEKGTLETTREVTEGVETPSEAMGDLEIAVTHSSEQNKGVLETPVESKGSLETTREATGGLETSREILGTPNGRRGSLETAVTRCLEQGRRSKGGLETSTKGLGSAESDPSAGGEVKSTSRRKAKTPARPRGSGETASTQCLEWERNKGGLETTRESRGGPGLPDLTGLPEPAGVPLPKEQVAEESAVISLDEDEEEEEEEEERDEGPARYLAALEAVQLELEAVEEEAARAFRRLRARFCLRRRPHLQRRNRLIQHIPGFWVTA
ncbi:TSYL2 protein, partial [Illadopsis cleaveri]|nr:TSYL2 protein [Illadopsis cleaveri]